MFTVTANPPGSRQPTGTVRLRRRQRPGLGTVATLVPGRIHGTGLRSPTSPMAAAAAPVGEPPTTHTYAMARPAARSAVDLARRGRHLRQVTDAHCNLTTVANVAPTVSAGLGRCVPRRRPSTVPARPYSTPQRDRLGTTRSRRHRPLAPSHHHVLRHHPRGDGRCRCHLLGAGVNHTYGSMARPEPARSSVAWSRGRHLPHELDLHTRPASPCTAEAGRCRHVIRTVSRSRTATVGSSMCSSRSLRLPTTPGMLDPVLGYPYTGSTTRRFRADGEPVRAHPDDRDQDADVQRRLRPPSTVATARPRRHVAATQPRQQPLVKCISVTRRDPEAPRPAHPPEPRIRATAPTAGRQAATHTAPASFTSTPTGTLRPTSRSRRSRARPTSATTRRPYRAPVSR